MGSRLLSTLCVLCALCGEALAASPALGGIAPHGAQRGMLDKTLVMVSSEFGRTPKINGTAGRDHWPKVFSVVLAGGGIKQGLVYGKSDATASEPEEDGLTVEDLAHTVYHCLGIDAAKKLMSPGDRPIDIVREGHTRKDLLA